MFVSTESYVVLASVVRYVCSLHNVRSRVQGVLSLNNKSSKVGVVISKTFTSHDEKHRTYVHILKITSLKVLNNPS